jgi:hypothetical protein
LTWATAGAFEDPATAAGTAPVELFPPAFVPLLFVEWPIRKAAPKPTAATAKASRTMRRGVLIAGRRL